MFTAVFDELLKDLVSLLDSLDSAELDVRAGFLEIAEQYLKVALLL